MSMVIDPGNTADNPTYDGIRDLAHIASTNAEIDVSTPFLFAERDIVRAIPAVRLPQGRTYANRVDVLLALRALAAVYFIRAGGRTASGTSDTQTTTTGELKATSMTIEGLTLRRDFQSGTTTSDVRTNRQSQVPYQDQVDFLLQYAKDIIQELGGSIDHLNPDVNIDGLVGVCRTKSGLVDDDPLIPFIGGGGQGRQKEAPTGDGVFPFISGDD